LPTGRRPPVAFCQFGDTFYSPRPTKRQFGVFGVIASFHLQLRMPLWRRLQIKWAIVNRCAPRRVSH
ncbi:MAG TPA: hypothetical protein VNB49_07790, partial [Candidatus Dormibacteraeota bacterium]|nr:hypothetical protein [Candidatus Dormibacteraeota bacterium]